MEGVFFCKSWKKSQINVPLLCTLSMAGGVAGVARRDPDSCSVISLCDVTHLYMCVTWLLRDIFMRDVTVVKWHVLLCDVTWLWCNTLICVTWTWRDVFIIVTRSYVWHMNMSEMTATQHAYVRHNQFDTCMCGSRRWGSQRLFTAPKMTRPLLKKRPLSPL